MTNYVKEYMGFKVPEGAVYFNPANECFYNQDKTRYSYTGDNFGWDDVDNVDCARNATELPQEPESKEWAPNIDEECFVEYPYDDGCFKPFHGKKVTILGYCSDSDGESVFTAHGSNGFIALYANGFRPLKTEKEKEREAFIENAKTLTKTDGYSNLFGEMFDAGFKAPEGE